MKTVVDYIELAAKSNPHKTAIVAPDGSKLSYSQVCQSMRSGAELPIPLLGKSWEGDFHLTTTGTTGRSKTVVIPQRAVIANSLNLISAHPYSENTSFIICGELTHLGNWSKIFPTLFQGGTIELVPDMKDVNRFFDAIDCIENTQAAAFLVPASIRLLLQYSSARLASYTQKLSFIETGGAPIAQSDMQRLSSLLPSTHLFNTYASTETGIVCTYDFNDHKQKSGCAGHPLPHSQVTITPQGRIAVSGETVMAGYLDDEALTATVLCNGTLTTADNGHFDADGMLCIDGRADDVLNVCGYKVNPLEVEQAALTHPSVADCICTLTTHPILGPILKLCVETTNGCTLDKKQLSRHILAQMSERYKVPQIYETVEQIRRTFNGKLDRKHYRQE